MQEKCDNCGRPAVFHLTEVVENEKIEKHLCEQCAVSEGYAVKSNVPISKLLEEFIVQSGGEGESAPAGGRELACDVCGLTYGEFTEQKVLGCPHDYDAFASQLDEIIEAEQGATQHIGKVPHRAGSDQKKQNAVLRLRAQLRTAIAAEDYEQAAALRDQIKELDTV